MSGRSTILALGACALSGCIGIPPMTLGAGAAASGKGARVVAAGQFSADVRPLALAPSLRERPVDVSVGAFSEVSDDERVPPDRRVLVGPTTSVDGYPITWPTSESIGRFVIGGELRALYQPGVDSWGPFVAERVGIEIAQYVEGCKVGGGARGIGIGCGAGEGGIGIFAEGSQGFLEGRFRYSAAFIVELRIPAGFAGGIPFPK